TTCCARKRITGARRQASACATRGAWLRHQMRTPEGVDMDEAKLEAFMGKVVNDMGGAALLACVILGEELGFYRALAHGKLTSPEQLASETGCHPRLVREWLNAQAASGYLEHAGGMFRLPPEQAMALADEG